MDIITIEFKDLSYFKMQLLGYEHHIERELKSRKWN